MRRVALAFLALSMLGMGLFNTHPPVRLVEIPAAAFCRDPRANDYPYLPPNDQPELVMVAFGKVRQVYGRVQGGTTVCVAWGADDEPKYLQLRCGSGAMTILSGPAVETPNRKWLPCKGMAQDFSK